jgi:large subunit ribosomal protein L17
MHRHGYKGRKFGRERDQRRALLKGLASNLVEHESIVTTVPKAKELVPYMEKLITKAKKGDLHNRRQVISKLANTESGHKLVDEIAPKLTARNSGHLRIAREGARRGDNAEMARVSFVDDLKAPATKPKAEKAVPAVKPVAKKAIATAKKPATKKPATKKATTKKEAK